MFEFSLLKSLYFELDPDKIEGAESEQGDDKKATFRRLPVSYDCAPEVTAIVAEERRLPYLVRYYLHIERNGERELTELKDREAQKVVYAFYREHFPGYLKEGLPEDLGDMEVLDCFEVFNMPSYRPKYAYPGLMTLEDLRAGRVKDERPQFAFPGLELIAGRKRRDPDQPAISEYDGYENFNGDKNKAKDKLESLKKRFSDQVMEMNGGKLPENFETEAFTTDQED